MYFNTKIVTVTTDKNSHLCFTVLKTASIRLCIYERNKIQKNAVKDAQKK